MGIWQTLITICTMPFLIKRLAFFGSILFLFASCDAPEEKGIELSTANKPVELFYTDTCTIQSSIVRVDSINTSNVSNVLVGSYKDPLFGQISSTAYIPFTINDTINGIPPDAVFDSLVFALAYDYVYGDTLKPNTIQVWEVDEDITSLANINYFKFNTTAIKPLALSEPITFKYSSIASSIVYIKINQTRGFEVFQKMRDITSRKAFRDYFKGIAVAAANTGGSVVGINLTSGQTNLRMYYHQPTSGNSLFLFSSTYKYYSSIASDLTGTIFSTLPKYQEISTSQFMNTCYVQNGTGLLTKITFPFLSSFKERFPGKTIMVNKAELELPVITSPPFSIPSSLTLAVTNESLAIPLSFDCNPKILPKDNAQIVYGLVNPCSERLDMGYTSSSNAYIGLVTFYVQSLLNEKIKERSFYVMPLGPINGSLIASRNMSVSRVLLGDPKHPTQRMKLKIYYTVVN